jgi:tetratricopeptide (TPR) repeat protein
MEALQRLEALRKEHPEALVPQDVQVIQALCLGRSERRSEAIAVLERLLLSEARLLDTQYLQYTLANWYFEEGLLDRAEKTYTSLLMSSQERSRWAELASIRLEQIRLKQGPGAALASEAPMRPGTAPRTSSTEQVLPPSGGVPVSSSQETLPQEETSGEEFPPPKEVASVPTILDLRASRLEEAKGLLENEHYEEAIAAFQSLLGTEYDAQAQEGIQEAEDRYAQKRRKEAAVLVLKARREGDLGKRKDLLVRAWEILRETVARYPGNRYAERIRRNMEDVLLQIREIDPAYEPQATLDGPSQTSSSSVQEEP